MGACSCVHCLEFRAKEVEKIHNARHSIVSDDIADRKDVRLGSAWMMENEKKRRIVLDEFIHKNLFHFLHIFICSETIDLKVSEWRRASLKGQPFSHISVICL